MCLSNNPTSTCAMVYQDNISYLYVCNTSTLCHSKECLVWENSSSKIWINRELIINYDEDNNNENITYLQIFSMSQPFFSSLWDKRTCFEFVWMMWAVEWGFSFFFESPNHSFRYFERETTSNNQEMVPKVRFPAKVLSGIVVLSLVLYLFLACPSPWKFGILISCSAVQPSGYTFFLLSSASLTLPTSTCNSATNISPEEVCNNSMLLLHAFPHKQQYIFTNFLVLSIDFGFRMDGLLMQCSKQIKKNLGSLLLTVRPWRTTRE